MAKPRGRRSSPSIGVRLFGAMAGMLVILAQAAHASDLPELPFTLTKPAGDGPFPAVVLLHDCSGLGAHGSGAPARWARELGGHGYVTLWPDSFSTRGVPDGVCTNADRPGTVRPTARA